MEPQVFDLLVFLVRNQDRVVSKDDLLASVWGGRIVSESTIASRINAVRRIIGDSGEHQRLMLRSPSRKFNDDCAALKHVHIWSFRRIRGNCRPHSAITHIGRPGVT
jgi:hypothetical protein